MRFMVDRLFIVLMSAVLTSCAFPVSPGPSYDSRENIPSAAPAFIVAGTTSRAEVLLRLGEPDGATKDDRQFVYVQRAYTGGYRAFLAGPGSAHAIQWGAVKMAYDRLIVEFDGENTVTFSRHERISCTEKYDSSHSDDPCMDVANLDMKLKSNAAIFNNVAWCRSSTYTGWWISRKSALEMGCLIGNLVIGDTAVLLYPENADNKSVPLLTLPYIEISSAEKLKHAIYDSYGIVLQRVDGSRDVVRVFSEPIGGTNRLEGLLLPRIKIGVPK